MPAMTEQQYQRITEQMLAIIASTRPGVAPLAPQDVSRKTQRLMDVLRRGDLHGIITPDIIGAALVYVEKFFYTLKNAPPTRPLGQFSRIKHNQPFNDIDEIACVMAIMVAHKTVGSDISYDNKTFHELYSLTLPRGHLLLWGKKEAVPAHMMPIQHLVGNAIEREVIRFWMGIKNELKTKPDDSWYAFPELRQRTQDVRIELRNRYENDVAIHSIHRLRLFAFIGTQLDIQFDFLKKQYNKLELFNQFELDMVSFFDFELGMISEEVIAQAKRYEERIFQAETMGAVAPMRTSTASIPQTVSDQQSSTKTMMLSSMRCKSAASARSTPSPVSIPSVESTPNPTQERGGKNKGLSLAQMRLNSQGMMRVITPMDTPVATATRAQSGDENAPLFLYQQGRGSDDNNNRPRNRPQVDVCSRSDSPKV